MTSDDDDILNYAADEAPIVGYYQASVATPWTTGTASTFEMPVTWSVATGTAASDEWNVYSHLVNTNTVVQWTVTGTTAGAVFVPVVDPEPVLLNHRGQPVRSARLARQFDHVEPEEVLALQLLRKMVSREEFRRYLRHGFVQSRAPSGLVYQVPRDDARRDHTVAVWERGELLARLCVHLRPADGQRRPPPTDHVVAKLLMVECDEAAIWARANVTWYTVDRRRRSLELVRQAA